VPNSADVVVVAVCSVIVCSQTGLPGLIVQQLAGGRGNQHVAAGSLCQTDRATLTVNLSALLPVWLIVCYVCVQLSAPLPGGSSEGVTVLLSASGASCAVLLADLCFCSASLLCCLCSSPPPAALCASPRRQLGGCHRPTQRLWCLLCHHVLFCSLTCASLLPLHFAALQLSAPLPAGSLEGVTVLLRASGAFCAAQCRSAR
jgi:hypothetical protein